MSDESRRALEFERRLESLVHGDSIPREGDGTEDLALRLRRSLAPPAPRAAFTYSARGRLLHRLPRESARSHARQVPSFGAVRRLAFAVASVLLAHALGTAGVAYAAQEALPGDALCSVQRGIKTARWSLTGEPEAQVELLSEFAAARVQEVEALAQASGDTLVAQTLEAHYQTREQLQTTAGKLPPGVRAAALAQAEAQVQQLVIVLERVQSQVPQQAQSAVERALERSSHSQEVLQQLEQGASPSDLAPGQDKGKPHGPKRTPGPPETKSKPQP